jgi:hypothetical protein
VNTNSTGNKTLVTNIEAGTVFPGTGGALLMKLPLGYKFTESKEAAAATVDSALTSGTKIVFARTDLWVGYWCQSAAALANANTAKFTLPLDYGYLGIPGPITLLYI